MMKNRYLIGRISTRLSRLNFTMWQNTVRIFSIEILSFFKRFTDICKTGSEIQNVPGSSNFLRSPQ